MTCSLAKLEAIRRNAAARIGVDFEEYEARRAAGDAWCGDCRAWLPTDAFVPNAASPTGHTGLCREHHRAAARQSHARVVAREILADALPDTLRSRPPLHRVRTILEIARARGDDFAIAWTLALERLPAEDREAVAATRDGWQRAYALKPATRAELAVGALVDILATLDDHERIARPPAHITSTGYSPVTGTGSGGWHRSKSIVRPKDSRLTLRAR